MNPILNGIGAYNPAVGPGPLDLFQFMQGFFGTALAGAVTQEVAAGQAAVRGWMHAAVFLWILVTCYLALAQNLPISRLFSRVLRALIVTALVVDTNLYNQFIVQPITTGIPNAIATAFSGGGGATTIPGQFSAIYLEIEHMAATLRVQASGWTYIADRVTIYVIGAIAKLFLIPQYALWIVTLAFLYLLAIAGTVAIVFWLFDATKGYAEAWAGKIVGALLATMMMSVVLQIVFLMNGAYMQQVANLPTTDGLDVSIGKGIDALGNAAGVFFFGIIMMTIAIGIGFKIGRATGFDAGKMLKLVTTPPRGR